MKIVITDGYALNPGDLSWESIAELGTLEVHERTTPDQLVERCRDAHIILSNKTEIRSTALEKLSNAKLIGVLATGFNVIDVEAVRNRNITVCNVPAYGTASVAQHAFALILALSNHVCLHAASVANGDWQRSADWSYSKAPIMELAGKTLGIVGMGNIGEQVARIAASFDLKVLYHNRNKKQTALAEYVTMDALFKESDIVSLHCPLTPENEGFVNESRLNTMKHTVFLINTARGQLINENDLASALNSNRIAGAALDVLSKEPPAAGNPLLNAKNCIITPHNAWMSKEARQRIIDVTVRNIKQFLAGEPVNVVS